MWLVEWGKPFLIQPITSFIENDRVLCAARPLVPSFDEVCQTTTRNFQILGLTTTQTHNIESFILYVYFNSVFCQ